jgi:GLPGLI family protein
MKNSKVLLAILLSISFIHVAKAQQSEKQVLKVSYVTNNVSDFMIGMLKKQITDPEKFSGVLNDISKYKMYHSLYHNLKTGESVFVLDSIHEVDGISTVGNVNFTIKNKEGVIHGLETFMGKEFSFEGKANMLKWNITNEKKAINKYKASKAILVDNPEIYVWFTKDVPANAGPYMYSGLPGLILEYNEIFQTASASAIQYQDLSEFNKKYSKFGTKKVKADETLVSVLSKKLNFKQTAEQGNN